MSELMMRDIQWYPGHMTKAKRSIEASISLVDAVVEILDARIPYSSRNPDVDSMIHGKKKLVLLNKCDTADPSATDKWISYYKKQGVEVLCADCKSGKGINKFPGVIRNSVLAELMEKRKNNGTQGTPIRLMIIGIPNVGKSSLINRLAKSKRAKVEDRPGVTRTKQWVKIGEGMELLDMPGVLWPKFEDQEVARNLAYTGAIKDDVVDIETLSCFFLQKLAKMYPDALAQRYKLTDLTSVQDDGYALLQMVARKRGMLISGGEVDTERAALVLLDDFRSGKLGRLTLELPEDYNG